MGSNVPIKTLGQTTMQLLSRGHSWQLLTPRSKMRVTTCLNVIKLAGGRLRYSQFTGDFIVMLGMLGFSRVEFSASSISKNHRTLVGLQIFTLTSHNLQLSI